MGSVRKVALLLVGIMLFALTACGKEQGNIQIVENLQENPEYLSFFSGESYADSHIGKYWVEQFMQQYNQKIYINYDEAEYYADEGLSYRELLEKRLRSSAPDDLYIIKAEDVLEFEKKGYWMDLSDMEFVNNLSEAAIVQNSYKGKLFALPLVSTGFGFYWNVNMLEKYGLAVPKNLDEFIEVCETLKANGILPYGANKGFALTVPAMCTGFDGFYANEDTEKNIAALNSGEVPVSTYMREGFEFLEYLIEQGYMDPEQALSATPSKEDIQLFLEGKCGFICNTFSTIQILNDTKGIRVEFTGLPVLKEGSIMVYGSAKRLSVNPNSKNLDIAVQFLEMVGQPEALDKSASSEYCMSSAKVSNVNILPQQKKAAHLMQQPGQIPNQDFQLHFNTWENIRDMGRLLCGGASVDEVCNKLDALQKADLEGY